MVRSRSYLSRRFLGMALLAAAALGLRLAVVESLAKSSRGDFAYEHGEIAANLAAGRGFAVKFLGVEGPTSQQAPLYPALLAACYRALGVGSPRALLAMQVLQCFVGAGLALAVARLGWSLVSERPMTGWIAGWGAAIYPTHVYMVTHIQVALWAALCLTLLLALAASPVWTNPWRKAALAGVLAGVLLLIEPILAIALPFAAWMFCAKKASGSFYKKRFLTPFLMAAGAAAVIAPWLWRNYQVHGEPVFVKSTFGYAFWQGNNPASWGTDKIPKRSAEVLRTRHDGSLAGMHRALWEARHETLYIDDVLLAPGGYREFAGLSEPARSRLLFSRACDFIRHEPGRYLRLCARRLSYFLLFDETNPKTAHRVYRIATVAWLTLAGIGSLALRSQWRRLWPTWAIFGAVAAFHSLTIVSARFRIPVEPISFVWAAGAVAPLVDRLLVAPWVRWRESRTAEIAPAGLPHAILQGPHRRAAAAREQAAHRRTAA